MLSILPKKMFPTASISQSQRSLSKVLQSSPIGYTYILSNNKKKGFLGDQRFIEFIETEGVLEQYNDWILYNDPKVKKAFQEGHAILESQDFSETLSFKELCQK